MRAHSVKVERDNRADLCASFALLLCFQAIPALCERHCIVFVDTHSSMSVVVVIRVSTQISMIVAEGSSAAGHQKYTKSVLCCI